MSTARKSVCVRGGGQPTPCILVIYSTVLACDSDEYISVSRVIKRKSLICVMNSTFF